MYPNSIYSRGPKKYILVEYRDPLGSLLRDLTCLVFFFCFFLPRRARTSSCGSVPESA